MGNLLSLFGLGDDNGNTPPLPPVTPQVPTCSPACESFEECVDGTCEPKCTPACNSTTHECLYNYDRNATGCAEIGGNAANGMYGGGPPNILGNPQLFYGAAAGVNGTTEYELECNEDTEDYITAFVGRSSRYLNAIGVECASGKKPDLVGGTGGTDLNTVECPGGFTTMKGHQGSLIDNVTPVCDGTDGQRLGGPGGGPWQFDCPSGRKIKKVAGKHGPEFIGSIGFVCE